MMSPHFGLMDETTMSKDEALLLRTKLHWRGGGRRMREGKFPEGITTIYDAILSAMRRYVLVNMENDLGEEPEKKLEDDQLLANLISRAGIFDDSVDQELIAQVVDMAINGENTLAYHEQFMVQAERILTKLAVLPFDESELPAEDPETF